ncbi:UDP-N-acetylmuramate dehydrogenase [Salicibibacter halophilus]|uniref:UDP-N-acetylenolpyruvoylglucosamine reductase n=1 Tax=Salicibibacter halophilus TaxID=2502791 RepID=A0A514LG02_9BACI|nr:UDP-N-acetylmuramate dehydrogenase [Salicibibacter halophilus]QDI90465.1 UDP-N-acetylmuramate dehydrogenase [Salicibibacter halophilus]
MKVKVEEQVPLTSLNTWRVGGTALFMMTPQNINEVIEAKAFSDRNNCPYFILGRGSNVLFNDEDYLGVIVNLSRALTNYEINYEEGYIYAEAGAPLPKLSIDLSRENIDGFDFFAGIPGTIGGAIAMNAGCIGSEMKDVLLSVIYIDENNSIVEDKVDELGMHFRKSDFQINNKRIIIGCRLKLTYGLNKKETFTKAKKAIGIRKEKFPLQVATAGSTFKSPPGGPYPGQLVEQVGLKGIQIGQAKISDEHGNWIINKGGASSKDINELMQLMYDEVKQKLGVAMEPEVIIL